MRAARTEQELVRLCLEPDRIRRQLPPSDPTYRGVELTIDTKCGPLSTAEDTEVLLERIATGVEKIASASSQPQGAESKSQAPSASPVVPRMKTRTVWLEIGPAAKWLSVEPENDFGIAVRPGIGWHAHAVYLRSYLGFGYRLADEVHRDLELAVGGGFDARWVQLGLVAGYGRAAPGILKSALEQSWFFGFEGALRLWHHDAWSLWADPSFAPLGQRELKVFAPNGEEFTVMDRVFRLDASVVLRGDVP